MNLYRSNQNKGQRRTAELDLISSSCIMEFVICFCPFLRTIKTFRFTSPSVCAHKFASAEVFTSVSSPSLNQCGVLSIGWWDLASIVIEGFDKLIAISAHCSGHVNRRTCRQVPLCRLSTVNAKFPSDNGLVFPKYTDRKQQNQLQRTPLRIQVQDRFGYIHGESCDSEIFFSHADVQYYML